MVFNSNFIKFIVQNAVLQIYIFPNNNTISVTLDIFFANSFQDCSKNKYTFLIRKRSARTLHNYI